MGTTAAIARCRLQLVAQLLQHIRQPLPCPLLYLSAKVAPPAGRTLLAMTAASMRWSFLQACALIMKVSLTEATVWQMITVATVSCPPLLPARLLQSFQRFPWRPLLYLSVREAPPAGKTNLALIVTFM